MSSNKVVAKKLINRINKLSESIKEDINIVSVCSDYSKSIYKYKIESLLPSNIKLSSNMDYFKNDYINIENLMKNNIIVTSLNESFNSGKNIICVRSPFDALDLAEKIEKQVVFLGKGFDVEGAITALSLKKAKKLICALLQI